MQFRSTLMHNVPLIWFTQPNANSHSNIPVQF